MIRTKRIEAGDWRTVESFWNANGTAFFKLPAGASIKVRYGVGFLGVDRQKQTLNGSDYKKNYLLELLRSHAPECKSKYLKP